MTVSNVTNSRFNNREFSILDFAPKFAEDFESLFYEPVYAIAFLALDLQTAHLSKAISKAKMRQEEARGRERKSDYAEIARVVAALLLLRDLLQIGWRITIAGTRIQLYQQIIETNTKETKQQVRDSMRLERLDSIQTKPVRDFIRYMERVRIVDDQPRSVLSLMADGQKLHSTLKNALVRNKQDRAAFLGRNIKPYLQLVDGDERDEFTGYRLYDIWRYFRLTWSTPNRSVPGRNIFYLVRDAGQPCHPVIGIAALANCVIGLKCRDDRIGWTPDAVAERMRQALTAGSTTYKKVAWEISDLLQTYVDQGIAGISLEGIATRNAVEYPTIETIKELENIALSAAEARYEHLRQEAILENTDELELVSSDAPVRVASDRYDRDSSKALFRRKRAGKLGRLLEAKLLLQQLNVFDNAPIGLGNLLWNDPSWKVPFEKGRSALRTVLNANKESKVGTSMMEIVVCGAVQPYNYLLGGKLVAMLLTSPQVVHDYEKRYGEQTSTIASQIAGYDITRPAHLAYLGTTSLYVGNSDKQKYLSAGRSSFKPSSSSQYNRIHIPAEVLKGDGELRYECIGLTEGFGVVHFSSETREALEELDILLHNARRVNSIFGEGTSPRMRKIRQGISLLGLDDSFLVHGQSRLVYGVSLIHNTERYLMGQDLVPNYIFPQKRPQEATKKIARYWISRWLTSRINYSPALEAVANFIPRQGAVSAELQLDSSQERLNLDV